MHNKPHTAESRLKMSLAHKGKKLSPEARENVVNAIKKRVAISGNPGFKKGHTFWLGKPKSKEMIEKMRVSKRGTYAGERHWNWKGGITKAREFLRKMYEYRQWRSDVYTRDDYTCQVCSTRGGDLEVDHFPKMFSQILDENKIVTREEARKCDELWNINNGRTLCKSCHLKTYKGVPKKSWQ